MDQVTFLWSLGICITVICTLIGFIVRMVLNFFDKTITRITQDMGELSKKVNDQEKEVDSIKYNYLDRFAKLHSELLNTKQEIIDRLNTLTR